MLRKPGSAISLAAALAAGCASSSHKALLSDAGPAEPMDAGPGTIDGPLSFQLLHAETDVLTVGVPASLEFDDFTTTACWPGTDPLGPKAPNLREGL